MYIILLGPPGSGKGTQAPALARRLGLAHVASGDLFRENLQKGTPLGILAKSYMEKGALVPDEVTIDMILERIARPDAAQGVVFDGFPRTLPQAEALDRKLATRGEAIDRVLLIEVPEDELIRRLSGRWICRNCQTPYNVVERPPAESGRCDLCGGPLYQREDDLAETARRRLEVYAAETRPLIDYYRHQSKLSAVNGFQSIETVEEDLYRAATAPKQPAAE